MSGLAGLDPTGRFTGLAEHYEQGRPGYPDEAVAFIMTRCGLVRGSVLVDVGSGTGISSRLFAARGVGVVGVEPNADMRKRAESYQVSGAEAGPVYRSGRAEDTGLAAGSADAVLAAQAFHWFETEAALREFHRLLKPSGWVVLVWNERDETDGFTAVYGEALRAVPGAAALERSRARAGDPLLQSPLFQKAERVVFANRQQLDEQDLLRRALSTSYAPRQGKAAEQFTQALGEAFARYQVQGRIVLHYQTSVYVALRQP
jgi:SAM-dependent methyltransferase